jgi:hypothetical protein
MTDMVLCWNAAHQADKEVFLEPVKWETPATSGLMAW